MVGARLGLVLSWGLGVWVGGWAAGAKGVTYGRNIFAHNSPEKIVEALAGIIFKNQTAKEVASIIGN